MSFFYEFFAILEEFIIRMKMPNLIDKDDDEICE